MRVRSFRARTAGERDGDGAATVTTPSGKVIVEHKLFHKFHTIFWTQTATLIQDDGT